MKGKQTSLYIHIPFCIKKCIYCDFLSVPYDEETAAAYMDAVSRELDMRQREAQTLQTVYIGGGTPTTIPAPALAGLIRKIMDSFGMASYAEVTVESNPGTLDRDVVKELSDAGMNRLSIGVQSLDNDELKLLGRIHTVEDALRAIASARRANVENMSIDLIYGIPGQTHDVWLRTIGMALELSPAHISAYELTPEGATPLVDLISQRRLEKPDEDSTIRMYYSAIEKLNAGGYNHYEISNFAKPGFECRHNLNYWNRGDYIGIGAGAHSFVRGERIKNTGDIRKYIRTLLEGKLPEQESTVISRKDAIKETVFLGLRKTEGLDAGEFIEAFGVDLGEASKELVADGLLEPHRGRVRLTQKGIVISNAVIIKLFEEMKL